jgi:RNA polymerase sigma-70 factor (ECF subfamily)
LLQESLAHAFVKLDQLEDLERFTPWLMAIVRTQFLNQLRKARPAQADEYWLEVATASPGEHPLAETLADALARLPRKQREILGLFYLDGLSQQETGQVLGLKPEVVGQRLHRARGALKRVLAKYPALGFEAQR